MKNTVDAVRYGIETLHVSPEEMFSLIESSNGYTGDDYKRWLANEIIKIAERDGVGYSQLLVKKFAITQSLGANEDATVKQEWLDYLKSKLTGSIYSVDFSQLGKSLDEVDWFTGIDYDECNSFFVDTLPEDISSAIKEDKPISLVSRLSFDNSSKSSELFKSAKEYNLTCKNEGSLMLYRMCMLAKVYPLNNFTFTFLTTADFLYNEDNADIIKFFLSYFKYQGFIVQPMDFYEDAYKGNDIAVVTCTIRGDSGISDGFVLCRGKLIDGGLDVGNACRCSRSSTLVTDKLKSYIGEEKVPCESSGVLSSTLVSKGKIGAYGYLNFDKYQHCWLSSNPDLDAGTNVAITSNNLKTVIAYYGVVKSLAAFGMSTDIYEFINGNPFYMELVYNCLPIFLFDIDSKFCSYGEREYEGKTYDLVSKFDIESSNLVKNGLERGEVYFSFEAKRLLDICKGFLDYLKEQGDDTKGKTFEEVRKSANHEELNKSYLSALNDLKDYVRMLYKRVE